MTAVEITYEEIHGLFTRKRRRDAHKGMFGRVLIIAGSKGMAGAAILCARGALRTGAGLVTLSVPDDLLPIVQTSVPEAICVPRKASLTPDILAHFDAIAIGPGLGVSAAAGETLSYVLENYGGKLVLDADALNIIAGSSITLDSDMIITPHPGEAAKLLGATVAVVQARREAAAAFLAEKLGCIAVLKGAGTLIAVTDPSLRLRVNTTGNPGMATGGSGDVLTGVIASLLAQGMPSETAACAGVYIHGLAGDLIAHDLGEDGLTAGDLPIGVARAIKHLSCSPNPPR